MIRESQLVGWTQRPSNNEDEKRDRTERMIRAAIDADPALSRVGRRVFAQGSYANNTNVRNDSDVDIAVQYTDGVYTDVASQDDQIAKRAQASLPDYTGPFPAFLDYKQAVYRALVNYFGADQVTWKNKCIEVAASTSRLPADVVACWSYRWFYGYGSSSRAHDGICLYADSGARRRIVNYPDQHRDNGTKKNNDTGRTYKRVVRILKRMENAMVDAGDIDPVPSFLIESLVHSADDSRFGASTWQERVALVLAHMHTATSGLEPRVELDRLCEVNDIKFLFHPAQPWTREQANDFALRAFAYLDPPS